MKNQQQQPKFSIIRERKDVADGNDFKNDDSDDENERGSSKASFLLHAESKRDGFLLLLLEIVLEKKDDDDFLVVVVQKCRRDGRAKALQKKNVFKVVHDDLGVFLFEKKKRECCKRLFLFV